LRPIGAYASEQLAKLRFRFVQLPHSRTRHNTRLRGLVNQVKQSHNLRNDDRDSIAERFEITLVERQ
jgi:hypothetical protein